MPTPTDLVTSLPADFEVFGQAVDSTLADLKGGTTGQVLSKNSNTDMDFVWVTDAAGDITGVTAGTGISGGGTSGTVTVTNSMATAIDAKGDLIAGTGADAFSRLAAGANDLILTAASGEATGLKYTGGYTSWTPTWTNLTVGNGTVNAKYTQIGKTVIFNLSLVFGSTTSIASTFPGFSLPINLVKTSTMANYLYVDNGVQKYFNSAYLDNATTVYLIAGWAGDNYVRETGVSATAPFTWATGDQVYVSGSYEVA